MENKDLKIDFRIMYVSVLVHWIIIITQLAQRLVLHQPFKESLFIANLAFSVANGIILASDAAKRKSNLWFMLLIGSVIAATIYLFVRNKSAKNNLIIYQ